MPQPGPFDATELRATAERVARAAGALLLDHASRGPVAVESKSSSTDMVSAADHASEELLVALLRAERPDDGLIGEEGASHTGTTGLTWVCDPLDGTTNYLYRLPQWAVSVAPVTTDPACVTGPPSDFTSVVFPQAASNPPATARPPARSSSIRRDIRPRASFG